MFPVFTSIKSFAFTLSTGGDIFSVSLQVISIVMDVFTDVDIFKEVVNASLRGIPVYILLDDIHVKSFLAMAENHDVNIRQLRVSAGGTVNLGLFPSVLLNIKRRHRFRLITNTNFHLSMQNRGENLNTQTCIPCDSCKLPMGETT